MTAVRSPLFIALVVIFLIIALFVHLNLFSTLDNFIEKIINNIALNELLLYFIIIFSSFGEIIYLILASIILTLIRRTRKIGMILMITIIMITLSITYMKPIIGHEKPTKSINLTFLPKGYNLEKDSMLPSATGFSFPSNHVASVTAFCYIVGFSLSRRVSFMKYIIWLVPIGVMASQLLLYESYFSDVLGGLLFGLILAIFTSNIMHLEIPFSKERFKK